MLACCRNLYDKGAKLGNICETRMKFDMLYSTKFPSLDYSTHSNENYLIAIILQLQQTSCITCFIVLVSSQSEHSLSCIDVFLSSLLFTIPRFRYLFACPLDHVRIYHIPWYHAMSAMVFLVFVHLLATLFVINCS